MQTEECIICFYDKPIEDYLYFGCGHRVCSNCHPLMKNTCPLCRYGLDVGPERLNDVQITIHEASPDLARRYSSVRVFICMMCYIVIIITICNTFIVTKL